MVSNFFEVIQKISGQNHSMALNFNLDFGGKWGSTLFMHGPFALGATPKFKFEGLIYYLASASIHSAGTLPGGIVQSLKKPACTLLQSGCLAEAKFFFRILAKSQKFSKSQIYAWPHLWMGPRTKLVGPSVQLWKKTQRISTPCAVSHSQKISDHGGITKKELRM